MPAALSIGDFSRATHLSIKTLRHYHRLELLVPADIDPATGYRRYTTEQIPTAQVIRRFRDLDMPLEDIGAILQTNEPRTRNDLITRHLARLEQGLARTQSAVASLRGLLDGPPPLSAITHRTDPETSVASITDRVHLDELSPWFQGAIAELYATLAAQRVQATGPAGGVISNEFFADEQGSVSMFVPAGSSFRPVGRTSAHVLPSVELATIVHVGSHADIDRSYGALAAYVSEKAIGIDGPIRERYLVGLHDSSDESVWRTEIGWPIFRTDTASLP